MSFLVLVVSVNVLGLIFQRHYINLSFGTVFMKVFFVNLLQIFLLHHRRAGILPTFSSMVHPWSCTVRQHEYLQPDPASVRITWACKAVANILGNICFYRAYESVFFMLSTSRGTTLSFLGYEACLTPLAVALDRWFATKVWWFG